MKSSWGKSPQDKQGIKNLMIKHGDHQALRSQIVTSKPGRGGRRTFVAVRRLAATYADLAAKPGRYGGTYAHRDIAFELASWKSSEYRRYRIKEIDRLKDDENRRLLQALNLKRTPSKRNDRIHTDAIKAHLNPPENTPAQADTGDVGCSKPRPRP